MNLLHCPDDSFANDLHAAAKTRARRAVIVHLRRELLFFRELVQRTSFVSADRQWLFREDRFAGPKCGRGNDGMRVIGSGDNDGIELICGFVEHLTEIAEQRRSLRRESRVVLGRRFALALLF